MAVSEIVIRGGRVLDPETSLDDVLNVGVIDARIAAITADDIGGHTTIDASGLVVSPGFVDTHFRPAGNAGAAHFQRGHLPTVKHLFDPHAGQ